MPSLKTLTSFHYIQIKYKYFIQLKINLTTVHRYNNNDYYTDDDHCNDGFNNKLTIITTKNKWHNYNHSIISTTPCPKWSDTRMQIAVTWHISLKLCPSDEDMHGLSVNSFSSSQDQIFLNCLIWMSSASHLHMENSLLPAW